MTNTRVIAQQQYIKAEGTEHLSPAGIESIVANDDAGKVGACCRLVLPQAGQRW